MSHPILIPFGPNANCNLDLCPLEWTVFKYRPAMAASISFIAAYSVLLCLHLYLGFRWRSRWFTVCMALGCAEEVIGYVGRIVMYHNPFSFSGFMIQIVCIGGAPVFYTAAIYVAIPMLVESLDVSLSRIPPRMYYIIFINADIAALVLQASGGALSTASAGKSGVADKLALTGLIFQVVVTFTISVVFADYLIRYFRSRRSKRSSQQEEATTAAVSDDNNLGRVKIFAGFIAAAILLILARCLYRVEELREGYRGEILTKEPLFIGLEGVLVVLAASCLLVGNPGFVLVMPAGKGLKPKLRASNGGGGGGGGRARLEHEGSRSLSEGEMGKVQV